MLKMDIYILYFFKKCDIYGGIKIRKLKSGKMRTLFISHISRIHLQPKFLVNIHVYSLDPPLANKILFVKQAITNLVIGSGGECPQDYKTLYQ